MAVFRRGLDPVAQGHIGETQSGHPFVQRDATDSQSGGISVRGVAYLNFMPFKGFTFTSRFGYRIAQNTSHTYTEPYFSTATIKADNNICPTAFRVDRPSCNTYAYYWNNSWKKPGDEATAKFPAANYWSSEAFSSSLTVFDGSYFKIKQIQLGYTLPQNLTKKVAISHLRVFAMLDNFFTFSKYIGLDQELRRSAL